MAIHGPREFHRLFRARTHGRLVDLCPAFSPWSVRYLRIIRTLPCILSDGQTHKGVQSRQVAPIEVLLWRKDSTTMFAKLGRSLKRLSRTCSDRLEWHNGAVNLSTAVSSVQPVSMLLAVLVTKPSKESFSFVPVFDVVVFVRARST